MAEGSTREDELDIAFQEGGYGKFGCEVIRLFTTPLVQ